jgi:hypothetical protein
LNSGKAALPLVERRQIVHLGRNIRQVEPDQLLHDGERALLQRLGVGVPSEIAIELRQIVQGAGIVAAARAVFLRLATAAFASGTLRNTSRHERAHWPCCFVRPGFRPQPARRKKCLQAGHARLRTSTSGPMS